ncbi:MAG: glutamate--tRNA ligase [Candidatus Pacebacteria bacterium]|nr:glutamate--tRNA ligase [Candidatus Paceibacterota bacterium]
MAETSKEKVRVRIAPSPTGQMHIGTARTALFNWLFARQQGGTFVLRIEDTDVERSKKEYETELLQGLEWLGLTWDEGPDANGGPDRGEFGPYRQSERTAIYRKYIQQLLEKGEAYYCYCTKEDLEAQRQALLAAGLPPRYNGHCRNLVEPPAGRNPEVIRFKVPEVKVEFKDLIHGKTSFDTALFGDQVIAKDLDTPLYNFAVVVDDALMEITHVIRGEDHLSNTPKQILMQRALGFPTPQYAHLPLILNPDRSKMSKRFADVALSSYRERGYLPDGIVNFIGLLGWHPKDDHEVFTREYALEHFEMSRVQQAGAIFNEEKLDFVNREHMKTTPIVELVTLAVPFYEKAGIAIPSATDANYGMLAKAVALQLGRAKTLADVVEGSRLFFAMPEYEAKLLCWKETSVNDTMDALRGALAVLEAHAANKFEKEPLLEALTPLTNEKGRGVVLWPLRVSLSGQAASPDPMEIMEVLGKDESIARVSRAIEKLEGGRRLF